MVSFMKSRRSIAGTLSKFQIPTLTYRGHYVNSTAAFPVNDPTCSHVLHPIKRRRRTKVQTIWKKMRLCRQTKQNMLLFLLHGMQMRWTFSHGMQWCSVGTLWSLIHQVHLPTHMHHSFVCHPGEVGLYLVCVVRVRTTFCTNSNSNLFQRPNYKQIMRGSSQIR